MGRRRAKRRIVPGFIAGLALLMLAGCGGRLFGPPAFVGTWVYSGGLATVTYNAAGTIESGNALTADTGKWEESGGVITTSWKDGRRVRERWRVSDDGKHLTLTQLKDDGSPDTVVTLDRR